MNIEYISPTEPVEELDDEEIEAVAARRVERDFKRNLRDARSLERKASFRVARYDMPARISIRRGDRAGFWKTIAQEWTVSSFATVRPRASVVFLGAIAGIDRCSAVVRGL